MGKAGRTEGGNVHRGSSREDGEMEVYERHRGADMMGVDWLSWSEKMHLSRLNTLYLLFTLR